jgi:hypothetical protein
MTERHRWAVRCAALWAISKTTAERVPMLRQTPAGQARAAVEDRLGARDLHSVPNRETSEPS